MTNFETAVCDLIASIENNVALTREVLREQHATLMVPFKGIQPNVVNPKVKEAKIKSFGILLSASKPHRQAIRHAVKAATNSKTLPPWTATLFEKLCDQIGSGITSYKVQLAIAEKLKTDRKLTVAEYRKSLHDLARVFGEYVLDECNYLEKQPKAGSKRAKKFAEKSGKADSRTDKTDSKSEADEKQPTVAEFIQYCDRIKDNRSEYLSALTNLWLG